MALVPRFSVVAACALGLVLLAPMPAKAACQLVAATASAGTKADAIVASRRVLNDTANDLKSKRGWRRYTISARKVKGDTFWKAVRPTVPPEAKLPPDVWSKQAFTTCWTGVVVPIVCTSGGLVCGN